MDSNTMKVIEGLSAKLGTTAEHLWSVLLKQAPISGCIALFFLLLFTVLTVLWARKVYTKTVKTEEWDGEATVFAWLSVVLPSLVITLIWAFESPKIMAALFNPEYWALMQIMSKVS